MSDDVGVIMHRAHSAKRRVSRVISLDSLRGIAALIVVFSHCRLALESDHYHHLPFHGGTTDPWSWLLRTPLCIVVDGSGAVLIFFALSGVVLAMSLADDSIGKFGPYLTKRALRIWTPFAATIILSTALIYLVGNSYTAKYSAWLNNDSWTVKPNNFQFLGSLDLISGHSFALDNPIWSLIHEARVSLIFPYIVLLATVAPYLTIFFGVLLLPLAVLINGHGYLATQVAQTCSYAFLFFAGAAIGTHLARVQHSIRTFPMVIRRGTWPVAIGLLMFAPSVNNTGANSWRDALHLAIPGVAAIVIVSLCTVENIVTRQLEKPFPMWLGRISYSLYLVHVPIILALAHGFPTASRAIVIPAAIIISLATAELLNRTVELPAQWIGRRLTARGVRMGRVG